MASLDSLPGDQRAVLQLVLGRGRSYDEIAGLLSINRVAVRERALAALDALGPQTKVDREQRSMIADYLLGQLSADEAVEVRDRLSESAAQRAWARVLSSELAPLSNRALPEIPVGGDAPGVEPPSDALPVPPLPSSAPTEAPAGGAPTAGGEASGSGTPVAETGGATTASDAPTSDAIPGPASPERPPRSSRLGGAILIAVAVVVVAVILVVVLNSGGGSKPKVASTPTSASTPSSSTTAASSSTTPKVVAQVNLTPTAAGSKTAGIAEVLDEGSTYGVAIVAQGVPPNTAHPPNAYAVWLYNSPTHAHFLGFVNPGVTSSGRLSTAGALPSDASKYKQLVVTVETSATPKAPGQIILQGTLTGVR
jgi:hypothetical protein